MLLSLHTRPLWNRPPCLDDEQSGRGLRIMLCSREKRVCSAPHLYRGAERCLTLKPGLCRVGVLARESARVRSGRSLLAIVCASMGVYPVQRGATGYNVMCVICGAGGWANTWQIGNFNGAAKGAAGAQVERHRQAIVDVSYDDTLSRHLSYNRSKVRYTARGVTAHTRPPH